MEKTFEKTAKFFPVILLSAVFFISAFIGVYAQDYSSPSFIIRAPVIGAGGSDASSTSFQANNSLGDIAAGISSGLNFSQAAGFSYFSITSTASAPAEETPSPAPASVSGGGSVSAITTGASFSGRAYPLSKISLLKDGQIVLATLAGPDSKFNVSLTGLSSGNYNFVLYGEDNVGRRSSLFSFPASITSGATTNIGGIFIAPTIAVDKTEVKKGDDIAIFGQTIAAAEVTIQVNSEEQFFVKTKSDKDGIYLYNFDTSIMDFGRHLAKSKSILDNSASPYGQAVGFSVGTKNVLTAAPAKYDAKADLNGDYRVNLIDFSVLAYWYGRILTSEVKNIDLNSDGKIDIKDFSIMAYYWTG